MKELSSDICCVIVFLLLALFVHLENAAVNNLSSLVCALQETPIHESIKLWE